MDGYTLLSNILVAAIPPLVWGALIFSIFYFLKGPIVALINRIKQLKWGKFEAAVGGEVPGDQLIQINTEPPPKEAAAREAKPLSNDAKAVLSTLWKHQQEHYKDGGTKGRWTFAIIMGASPLYVKYLRGVCELMERALVGISPQNGQSFLTDQGIQFCQNNPGQLLTDWDFHRWNAPAP